MQNYQFLVFITIIMAFCSACHLKMRGDRKVDRLTQGRQSMVIDYSVMQLAGSNQQAINDSVLLRNIYSQTSL